MKKITILIISVLLSGQVFGQTDGNGNPVFNSISTNEKLIEGFTLIENYYTLKNNIDNKLSSVFISETPTLDQIENAALNLPSSFYLLLKERKMVLMMLLQNEPEREFLTIITKTNQQLTYPCSLIGNITENRANEIVKENFDPNAKIENGVLTFNGKEFSIITNKEIEEAVWKLIKKEKLDKKKPSDIILPSKNELKSYILSESKRGGSLDFFTEIEGKEYDAVQIRQGVFTTKLSVALYMWGRACFDIGVNTLDDVYEIFSEFKSNAINERDKEYIKKGFNKEWEK